MVEIWHSVVYLSFPVDLRFNLVIYRVWMLKFSRVDLFRSVFSLGFHRFDDNHVNRRYVCIGEIMIS